MAEAALSHPADTVSYAQPTPPRLVWVPVAANSSTWLAATLTALLRNTTPETPIFVSLASADAVGAQSACQQQNRALEDKRLHWLSVAAPFPGFVDPLATLAALPTSYQNYDVILASPGLEVPYGWDARLALSALENPLIASVSPLCDAVPWWRVLEPTADSESASEPELEPELEPTAELALATVDQAVCAWGRQADAEIPALFGRCVYLKRAALDRLGPLARDLGLARCLEDWGWGLSKALQFAGGYHLGCGHVYVRDHDPSHRPTWQALAAREEIRLFAAQHPLTTLRATVQEALAQNDPRQAPAVQSPLAVQLHIAHSWGGGQERWLHDYCTQDTQRLNLVLRSMGSWGVFGEQLALYRSSAMDVPLRRWELTYPIRSTAIAHLRYQTILREIIADFRVEVLLISSLIGHSLDALRTEVPTVFITHDYYPYCHAINIHFQEICIECPPSRLARCFAENDQNRHFANMTPPEWLALRHHFSDLLHRPTLRLVAPSASVPRHLNALMPELADKPFAIIPHGVRFERIPSASAEAAEPEPIISAAQAANAGGGFRVLILGSLVLHKGRKLLETICQALGGEMEFYLVGCGEDGQFFTGMTGVQVVPYYVREELPTLVGQIRPQLGLLLSIVPETYSYTLSELWLLGVPVVATEVGSFGDRISHGINGLLCAPEPNTLIEQLRRLRDSPALLARLRDHLADSLPRTPAEMVADYHALTPLPAFSRQRYFAESDSLLVAPSAATSSVPPIPSTPPAVIINPQARFPEVLREFQGYALNKLSTSPRLSATQRRWFSRLFRRVFRGLEAMAKRLPMG